MCGNLEEKHTFINVFLVIATQARVSWEEETFKGRKR